MLPKARADLFPQPSECELYLLYVWAKWMSNTLEKEQKLNAYLRRYLKEPMCGNRI